MAWFLVPRLEVHQSLLLVEAADESKAWEAVHEDGEGTEVDCEYHRTPEVEEQPGDTDVEELTVEQARERCAAAYGKRLGNDEALSELLCINLKK